MTSTHKRAVGIFPDRPKTASALQALSDSGFNMKNVSVIAKDPGKQNPIAGVDVKGEVSDKSNTGGKVGIATGGVLGGVTGLLVGLGTLTIPGIGPAIAAGEAGAVLSTVLGGATGAVAGGLVGALIGLGIPKHRAKRYRDRVAAGDYLVMLKDTDPEIARAEETLKATGIEDWGVYTPLSDSDSNAAADARSDRDYHNRHQDSRHINGHDRDSATHDNSEIRDNQARWEHDSHSTSLPHASNPMSPVVHRTDSEHGDDYGDNYEGIGTTRNGSGEDRRVLGIFQGQDRLEDALGRLKQSGFPMQMLSILVREAESGDTVSQRSQSHHPLAGATSLASGLNHVHMPQVGSVMVMGPDSDSLSHAIEHDDSSSVVGVLKDLGISEESAYLYSRHLTDGAYLVTLKGKNQDVMEAASTLGQHGMRDWGIYDIERV